MRSSNHERGILMRTFSGVRGSVQKVSFVATAAALGCLLSAGIASAHDMAAMDGMDGSDPGAMNHTMAPAAMGGHMAHMGNHMRMTDLRPSNQQDEARARDILETLRGSIAKYRDYHVALAKGMRIFLPGIPQDVYHFTDYATTGQEYRGHFDLSRPGSLLYSKNPDGGYTLVGAMYSAPPEATPDDLDAIVPLSIARWHVHTNICLPKDLTIEDILRNNIDADGTDVPGMLPVSATTNAVELNHRYGFLADGRFGFEGKISDARECSAAGGHLLDQAFGWMVHVYPFAGDDLKVAYGMDVPKPTAISTNISR
jgi:hypothetical protein